MSFRDYYAILGLPFGATPEQIERAYKLLVRMSHPDAFPNHPEAQAWANERMKQIHEAYETLSDSDKRANYDRTYRQQAEAARQEEQARREPREARVRCPLCEGTGRTTCLTCHGKGDRSCPGCAGERIVVCPICQGVGALSQTEYDHLRREAERAERQSREAAARAEEGRRQAEIARQTQADRTRKVAGAGVSLVVLVFLARGCLVSSPPQTAQVSPEPVVLSDPDPSAAEEPSDPPQAAEATTAPDLPPPVPQPFWLTEMTPLSDQGAVEARDERVTIGGLIYERYVRVIDPWFGKGGWVVYDVGQAYSRFTTQVGVIDMAMFDEDIQEYTIYGDGNVLAQGRVHRGNAAVSLDVPITGVRALKLRTTANEVIFAAPQLRP